MKRWQDLGEVEDSDDEDLAFSNESQSQSAEHARKRQRLLDSKERGTIELGFSHEVTHASSVEGTVRQHENRASPGPKIATTSEESTPTGSREPLGADSISRGSVRTEDSGHDDPVDDEESWLQPKHPAGLTTTTYSRKVVRPEQPDVLQHESPAGVQTRRLEAVCVTIPSQRAGSSVVREAKSDSSIASDSEDELPSLNQILARQEQSRPRTPANEELDRASVSSSPLSELNNSPPLPDIFTFGNEEGMSRIGYSQPAGIQVLRQAIDSSRAAQSVRIEDAASGDDAEIVAQILEADHAAGLNGGRTFRARKEKQLHPYIWEKSLYERQMKQRGVKPVHVKITDRRAPENHDRSYSGDDSDSQERAVGRSDSPAAPSSELGDRLSNTRGREDMQAHADDDNFPDIDALIGRNSQGAATYDGRKRRKVTHVQGDTRASNTSLREDALAEMEGYSVPPSPPPTSSDSIRQNELPRAPQGFRTLPSGFRVPIGRSPAPLPTPQVSSDVRPTRAANHDARSGTDSPPPRSRPSALAKHRPKLTAVESGTESQAESAEGAVSEAELEDKGLRRVQKRIRGVLPASWLKIDLQSRRRQLPPSPTRPRRLSTASPPRTAGPQKGLAQRVMRTATTPGRSAPVLLYDDQDSGDERPTPVEPTSSRPAPGYEQLDLFGSHVDEDRMEVDWVDPMLAGGSRGPRTASRSKKRQPRISDVFRKASSRGIDFSEERAGMQHRAGGFTNPKRKVANRVRPSTQSLYKRSAAPRLSVLDAPSYSPVESSLAPQFLRVAQRQVRKRADRGRHSPSRKVIRLATMEDTDEAVAVLAAWREGTIAPRISPGEPQLADLTAGGGDASDEEGPRDPPRDRHPLEEITNLQQQVLPTPQRKEARGSLSHRQQPASSRLARVRQTQLQPIRLQRASDGSRPSPSAPSAPAEEVPSRTQRRRGHLLPDNVRYRGAQLESLENAYDQEHRAAAFERHMNILTEAIARPGHAASHHPVQLLDRYLDQQDHAPAMQRPINRDKQATRPAQPVTLDYTHAREPAARVPQPAIPFTLARRPRKRPPRHIDTDTRRYRQPSEPLPDLTVTNDLPDAQAEKAGPILEGLASFGTRYATDFDIQPLPLGTYFHQSTFIGSGDLAASLQLLDRDLSVPTGHLRIHVAGEIFEWGAWTESEVAAGLDRIPHAIADAIQALRDPVEGTTRDEQLAVITANVDHMLRSVVRYCSRCLTFLDKPDRRSCVQHLQQLVENVLDLGFDMPQEAIGSRMLQARCWQYALVVATQAMLLSKDEMIAVDARQRSEALVIRAAQMVAGHLLPKGLEQLQLFYEANRLSTKREAGIRDDDSAVCGIVLLHHCVSRLALPQAQFWRLVEAAWHLDASSLTSVTALDKVWYGIFTILPVMEIDSAGVARPGTRLRDTTHDWSLPKMLIARLFRLYPGTSSVRGASLNDYVRATLTRSFYLLARWGWTRCETMLGVIFDFYAQRNLAQLTKEESRGSPRFLDDLEATPSLEVQPEDRSFAVFLKMLALGLQNMRKYSVYNDRKIGGIAWRFIPNHGRTYPRDADVKQSDMDALRNHHDLLCTLYYAAPSGHRLRVDMVRNLVDHTSSHREACRLSVRAWTTLTSFLASTSEGQEALQPLTSWFDEILQTTMVQFRLAKTEAERDFAAAKVQAPDMGGITDALLTSTIAANQRQIAATLVDALVGLKRALSAASPLPIASTLVEGCAFWRAFVPFDATEKRLVPALREALEVVKTALGVQRQLAGSSDSQGSSEESQDYGDSSALQEYAATKDGAAALAKKSPISDHLHEPVAQLVSNVFGADASLEDPVLETVVDVWALLAKDAVDLETRPWSSFVDAYSPDSWHQLRDTDQKRKFTPYFLACVTEGVRGDDVEVRSALVTALLVSLVERAALLKYQHLLVAALLNSTTSEPLLQNLPFSQGSQDKYTISLIDLRERRLAVLSSILSNMREDFEHTLYAKPRNVQQVRRLYGDMLRALMQAMKSNYQQLQSGTSELSADPDLQGAYVTFVQQVVYFLQQYTTDICRVDKFFEDSAAFPLPHSDPEYVVGKLRSYVPRLADGKTRKKLAVFIHTVSERAAIDGKQDYLVDQLSNAMHGVLERGDARAPSLRHVLLTAVFPAYMESALATASSWILALPILRASGAVCRDLLYNVELEKTGSVNATIEVLAAVLRSLHEPLQHSLAHPGLLRLPHVQRVLAQLLDLAGGMLTICEHLQRRGHAVQHLLRSLRNVRLDSQEVKSHLRGTYEERWDAAADVMLAPAAVWPDTRVFVDQQLRDEMSNWHAHDGSHFVRRGNTSREVVVSLDDEEEEKGRLLTAIENFCASFDVVMSGGQARIRRFATVRGSCSDEGVMDLVV